MINILEAINNCTFFVVGFSFLLVIGIILLFLAVHLDYEATGIFGASLALCGIVVMLITMGHLIGFYILIAVS